MLFTALNAIAWLGAMIMLLCIRPFAADRMTWMALVVVTAVATITNTGRLFSRSKK